MQKKEKLYFKVSSNLKNIIGKDLITNDYNAVFELIKNSYDANASNVEVFFDHHDDNKNPTLIIKDDGDGMNLEDIKNKWLFVAYSEKEEERKKEKKESYRDLISKKRIQAGAKGIGRFSCDKLGDELIIYTKKKNEKETHIIRINWNDFENISDISISEVDIEHYSELSDKIKTVSGTILEIPKTRENWDRNKYLKLRKDLEKLINPNQKYGDDDKFSIILNVPSELSKDKKKKEEYKKDNIDEYSLQNIVNGRIENFLFENLGQKTIAIHSKISNDGKEIETELRDKDILIYSIKEKIDALAHNDGKLSDINIHLFFLDKDTKSYLTRESGSHVAITRYFGSVALYKNGFRIYPFGEPGDDSLGLDSRQTQGYNRFLGTRNLIGRIEIGDNDNFRETSSRDGGLIKNKAYNTLEEFFLFTLRRFEKYVVDIIKYKNFPEAENIDFSQPASELKEKLTKLITKLSNSKSIVDIKYDNKVAAILKNRSDESEQKIFSNLKKDALDNNDTDRLKKIELAEKITNRYKQDYEHKKSENIFLRSLGSKELKNALSLHHHIKEAALMIEDYISEYIEKIKDNQNYSIEDFKTSLQKIDYNVKKIQTVSNFAVRANFNIEKEKKPKLDLCNFIEEYLMNICSGEIKSSDGSKHIKFHWSNKDSIVFKINMEPTSIAMIFDNLIRNSLKADARNIYVSVENSDNDFIDINFADDGIGVTEGEENEIFEFGYTTTYGTGLGLYHTKEILKSLNGNICLDTQTKYSTCFKMRIGK